jgi:ArsR family transcriptional regulator
MFMSMHDNLSIILKALADPTRLDIIRTIVKKQAKNGRCSEVSNCSSLSQPAMSHHFKKLVDAGVLIDKKIGVEKEYELNTSLLASVGIDVTKF